jgi:NADPH-dependent 2,4-dienoyl-CoA reductase/sulfur reductase-like enzyme
MRYVIVGAGQAGRRAAETLATAAPGADIILIGAEPHPPYNRPPLSKQLLSGEMPLERMFQRAANGYAQIGVQLRMGRTVQQIDRTVQQLHIEGEPPLAYDRLVLTTGSRPRQLVLPGAEALCYLRALDDALALRARLQAGVRLIILGGGFIGMEVAASARRLGAEVCVLEAGERLMARALPPLISRYAEEMHRSHGVEMHFNVQLQQFEPLAGGRVRVVTAQGPQDGDLVLAGIGVQPNVELAAAAGLACDNGITVDEYGATADANIFAAGDVTYHFNPLLGRHLRVESWQVAQNQPPVVVRNLLGERQPYAELPWLWSDQYDCNIQLLGLFDPAYTPVLRGEPESGRFIMLGLDNGGVPRAAVVINQAREMAALRTLLARAQPLEPERVADPSLPISKL